MGLIWTLSLLTIMLAASGKSAQSTPPMNTSARAQRLMQQVEESQQIAKLLLDSLDGLSINNTVHLAHFPLSLNYSTGMWQVWTLSLLMTLLAAGGKSAPATAVEEAPGNSVQLETALPTNSSDIAVQAVLLPMTARFNSSAPRLIQQYQRRQHIATALLDTLDGLSEELACAKVEEYIASNLTETGDADDACMLTYNCSYVHTRYPATLIEVSCPRFECLDKDRSRGTCVSSTEPLSVLKFVEAAAAADDEGSGERQDSLVKRGEWEYATLLVTKDCYCTDSK